VAIAWLAPLAAFVFAARFLLGYDAYFHLQLAEVMAERGIFLQEFPWATESMWADTWFDKEWLFHVLLIPFLSLGKVAGGKAHIVFANLLIIASSWYCLRSLRVGRLQTFFWIAVLPWTCWGVFWVRLSLCRPQLLALALLLVALGAMAARRHLILGVVSFLYALSHTGHWQLLGLALILDCFRTFFDDEGRRRERLFRGWPLSVPVLIGIACGEVLHPNFPANLEGLYVQNVLVVLDSWSGEWAWMRPDEFKPAGFKIFKLAGPFFVGLVWVMIRSFRSELRGSCNLYALATCCLLYLLLAVNNFRFLEYSTPIGVLFLAVFFSHNPWSDISDRYLSHVRIAIIASIALAFALSIDGYLHYYRSYNVIWKERQGNDHIYAHAPGCERTSPPERSCSPTRGRTTRSSGFRRRTSDICSSWIPCSCDIGLRRSSLSGRRLPSERGEIPPATSASSSIRAWCF
jgi:hypothetical protein